MRTTSAVLAELREELGALLDELTTVLAAERKALRQRDSEALQAASARKLELVTTLEIATGKYCLEFASIPDTPGTCEAIPAECTKDAPGQLRSCTHKIILYFCPAAAISIAWLWPLHAFRAMPV